MAMTQDWHNQLLVWSYAMFSKPLLSMGCAASFMIEWGMKVVQKLSFSSFDRFDCGLSFPDSHLSFHLCYEGSPFIL